MASDDHPRFIDQHRHCEAPLANRGRDLSNLRLAMRPRIARVGDQAVELLPLDAVGWPLRHGLSGVLFAVLQKIVPGRCSQPADSKKELAGRPPPAPAHKSADSPPILPFGSNTSPTNPPPIAMSLPLVRRAFAVIVAKPIRPQVCVV